MQRALQLQEKQAMRLRQREAAVTGPKDDLVRRGCFCWARAQLFIGQWLLLCFAGVQGRGREVAGRRRPVTVCAPLWQHCDRPCLRGGSKAGPGSCPRPSELHAHAFSGCRTLSGMASSPPTARTTGEQGQPVVTWQ